MSAAIILTSTHLVGPDEECLVEKEELLNWHPVKVHARSINHLDRQEEEVIERLQTSRLGP